jgi:hypothetical protein
MRLEDEFDILVDTERGRFKVRVKCTYVSTQIYRFIITGGEREIHLRCDFPAIYSKKKRVSSANWKIEKGEQPKSGSAFYEMINKIEQYLVNDYEAVQ